MEPDHQEVKRLKFSEEDDEEEDEEEEQEVDTLEPSDSSCLSKEAEAMVQEKEEKVLSEASSSAATEEQGMHELLDSLGLMRSGASLWVSASFWRRKHVFIVFNEKQAESTKTFQTDQLINTWLKRFNHF